MSTPALLLFAKFPAPGKVKTRLIPRLGAQGAAAFAEACLLDLLERLAGASWPAGTSRILFYTPSEALADFGREPFAPLLSRNGWKMIAQAEGNLGARLKAAQELMNQSGSGPLVYLGTDCPELPDEVIAKGLAAGRQGKACLAPSSDGGYVMLALPEHAPPEVFDGIEWSSAATGKEQLRRIRRVGLEVVVTEPLSDVDEPAALGPLLERLRGRPACCPRTLKFLIQQSL